MKYHILTDHGLEGHSISDKEYKTVDDAVKVAMNGCSIGFHIIQIIDWEAKEKTV